ncbi:hypothetical protein M501DRAFT_993750 [Patellaria atrata CBS 101060]|uniref:Uncharacterized protein n=1 Tax=Patellaria atrata CBS 101060 TaxID=1346257 RepID=A0A9P4SHD4_9PEZI|nr:hypothetical protein M501DRAFT_993750 [Patellaria atrata CBS 101060]
MARPAKVKTLAIGDDPHNFKHQGGNNVSSPVDEAEEDGVQPDSQELDAVDVGEMLKRVLQSSRTRRQERRKKFEESYAARFDALEGKITTTFDTHRKRVVRIHKAQLDHLIQLLQRKQAIEQKMAACVQRLERAHASRTQMLQNVVKRRLRHLEKE